MVAACCSAVRCAKAHEKQARAEWQRLCFVLEGIQAKNVIELSADKYAFARSYTTYQAEEARTIALLTDSIDRGDYEFFVDRGVPSCLLCRSFACQLLCDWKIAIVSKQARLAEAFQGRFGEDIEVFCVTSCNLPALKASSSSDASNAIWLLAHWNAAQAKAV